MLIQEDLGRWKVGLREVNSAGEPSNPEVIDQVRHGWGLTLRDSYGQTETTMMVGNSPGQKVDRRLDGPPAARLSRRACSTPTGWRATTAKSRFPFVRARAGLMRGYLSEAGEPKAIEGAYYRTGDVASRDAEGYITFVGRADDVFKSSDFRLSPFELESALIEHEAIAEAAVVPAPDPLRFATPEGLCRAGRRLRARTRPPRPRSSTMCGSASRPIKRVRRIEFAELPKTPSGKIRRVELRGRESALAESGERAEREFRIEDFPEG